MRVGLVLDESFDGTDGIQQYMLQVSQWLRQHGHDVFYLVGETKRRDEPNIYSLSKNVHVRFNGNRLSMPLPTSRSKLKDVLDELQLDILHVQTPYSPFMGGRLIELVSKQTAVIGTFHILPYSWLAAVGSYGLRLLNAKSARRFDAMMAVSEPARQFAASHFGFVKSVVVPNCFDSLRFQTAESTADSRQIVFLGRLVERKGPLELLSAVELLRRKGRLPAGWRVVIGGKGQLHDKLASFIRDHELDDTVTMAGFVSEDDKPAFLAAADIAIFPSTGGESFGISLIEAMAAARGVVLAGDNPGYRSVMEGFENQLFDPSNTSGIADLLESWMSDDKKRIAIANKQRVYVKRFDVSLVGKQIEDIYTKALQKRRES